MKIKSLSHFSLALLVSLPLSSLTSCDEYVAYPENMGCGLEIFVSAEVASEVLSLTDISSESPLEIVKVTIPVDEAAYRSNSTGVIDENGKVTFNYPHVWRTEPIKFIAWWPATANVVTDAAGEIVSVSDDCKLIGETQIYSVKPKDAHIILRDYIPE